MKIAVGGFQHETNSFAKTPTGMEDFLRPGGWPALTRGEEMFDAVHGLNLALPGFISEASRAGHSLVPLLWANAAPGGPVTDEAFERISALLIADIAAMGPFEAIYLDLHGAMVTERYEDGEGELLTRIRAVVGPKVQILASLDWHANVTRAMQQACDVMVGYRTYPHIDMEATGRRVARLIGREFVVRVLRPLPFLIPLTAQCSLAEPNKRIFRRLEEIEAETGAVLTFAPGFAPADIHDCGPTIIAYGDTTANVADAMRQLSEEIIAAEAEYAAQDVLGVDEAIAQALKLAETASRPVILADTQDNPGAGAGSDTTGLLRGLIKAGAQRTSLAFFYDPAAVEAAQWAGEGQTVTLWLGGKSGVPGDEPFQGAFTVGALGDGKFEGTGPMWQGAHVQLGRMAKLEIGGVSIVVGSTRQQPSTQALFRHVGIEPAEQAILALKSSVHFRADFQDMAEAVLVVAAPGVNLADPTEFPYKRLRSGVRLKPLGPTR
jgi:microcystin degradation protein MlrC